MTISHCTVPACAILLLAALAPAPKSAAQAVHLEPGKRVELKISASEIQTFRISVSSGQFLQLMGRAGPVNLTLTLYAPDGTKLLSSLSGGLWFEHRLAVVARASGDYRLDVQASESPRWAKGNYQLGVGELSIAVDAEQRRAEAARLLIEARGLLRQELGSEAASRQADTMFEEARGLFHATGDLHGESLALNELGSNAALGLHQERRGLDYLNQALSNWRLLSDLQHQVTSLNTLAWVATEAGRNEEAHEHLTEALSLARSLADPKMVILLHYNWPSDVYNLFSEDRLGRILEILAIARNAALPEEEAEALNNVGVVYGDFQEYQQAIAYHVQALEIWRKLNQPSAEGGLLHNIGLTYSYLGDYRKAIENYTQAMPLLHAAGQPNPEARSIYFTGEAYEKLGEPANAVEAYNQIAGINRTSRIPIINPYSKSVVGLARIAASHDQREKAINYLNEALGLALRFPPRLSLAKSDLYISVGLVFDSLRERDKALDAYQKSLETARSIKAPIQEAKALFRIGVTERDMGRLADARSHAVGVIEIIESQRTRIGDPDFRASYLSTVRQHYDLLTDILMRLHRGEPNAGLDAVALQNSERARARVLLELLREARAGIRQGVDGQLLNREMRLRKALNARALKQTDLLSEKAPPEQLRAIRDEIRQLSTEYQQVQADIRKASPRYAALTQPKPLTVKEIRDEVLDAETALVEYQLGDERSYMWVVTKDSLAAFELQKRPEINAAALRVYELLIARAQHPKNETLQQRRARIDAADAEYPLAARALSQMVLQPAAGQLDRKRLLIVADGALQYVPFAALPGPQALGAGGGAQGSGRERRRRKADLFRLPTPAPLPLIADHEIVMLPSASVLAMLRRETSARVTPRKAVAALADPVFDKDDPRVKPGRQDSERRSFDLERTLRDFDTSSEPRTLSRLPFTRQEAQRIRSAAPSGSVLTATDFKASRATALDPQLSQYRVVHFATHALLNAQRPELSGIVLSLVDEKGEAIDGFLRLNEIYNLNLAADLVVLSACQTGLGKDVNGEGLLGLTRGFMYAGALCVMTSLWKINDSATADIMERFYREFLNRGKPPSAALREAQLQMLRQQQFQAPYYWAAFVTQGEYR